MAASRTSEEPGPMTETHQRCLEENRIILLRSMDLLVIIASLRERGLITQCDCERIDSANTGAEKAEQLISLLLRSDDQAFAVFMETLQNHQPDLFTLLKGKQGPNYRACVHIKFFIECWNQSKKNKKKNRARLREIIEKLMSDPHSDFRKHLKKHYHVSTVELEDCPPDNPNQQEYILYSIPEWLKRIREDVEHGQMSSILEDIIRSDAGSPQHPWKLECQLVNSDSVLAVYPGEGDAASDVSQKAAAAAAETGFASASFRSRGLETDGPDCRDEDVVDASGVPDMEAPRTIPHEGVRKTCAPSSNSLAAGIVMTHSASGPGTKTGKLEQSSGANNSDYSGHGEKAPYAPANATVDRKADYSQNVLRHHGPSNPSAPLKNKPRTGPSLKDKLFEMIANKRIPHLEFCQFFRMSEFPIDSMNDDQGRSCLHLCIVHDRADLLKLIHAAGVWPYVASQKTNQTCDFPDCTPVEYAEKKRLRRFVKKIKDLTDLETAMGGQNAALKFCRAGKLDELKNAINQPDHTPRPKDTDDNNLLHWASVSDNPDMVRYIIKELKVDPKKLNRHMQSPLHIAVTYGSSNLVELLLKEGNLDPRQIDVAMKTPIQIAAENGDEKILQLMKSCSVDFSSGIVVDAAKSGSKRCMQYLVEECRLNSSVTDEHGKQCHMVAASHGHLEVLQYLLEQRSMEITTLCEQNRNVLHYAATGGHKDVVKYILRKAREAGELSALLNRRDKHSVKQNFSLVRGFDRNRAAWHYIYLKRRYIHLFDKCTKSGKIDASVVGVISKSGWGEEPDVGILDVAVADFKEKHSHKEGKDDLTPMMLAITKGHLPVVNLLLEAGTDVTIKDCFGQTSLHLAAMRGYKAFVKQLVDERNFPAVVEDEDNFTPLGVARRNEQEDVIAFLVDKSLPRVDDFNLRVEKLKEELSREKLTAIRRSGKDMLTHVIQTVRDLQIDINVFLKEIGSGPVMEETRPAATASR